MPYRPRRLTALARVQSARAGVTEAQLNLDYTSVAAPISGVTGRAEKSEGSLVASGTDLLTRLSQVDPIYANFSYSENEMLRVRDQVAAQRLSLPPNNEFKVELRLSDGSTYPHMGRLNFNDFRVQAGTGTIGARAVFPNPKRRLLPGQFVRVALHGATRPNTILIPQQAAMTGPVAVPEVPVGLPSSLLVRRPDILAAEQSLIAANARISAAKAAYFPRISLTGLLGVESTELSDWFSNGSRIWQVTGGLAAPIFTAGRLGAEVEAASAQQQQLLYDYLRTIQTSFREVEDSLIAARKTREQQEAQAKQVQALQRTLHLATLRYENGYSSYLEVLDAQRALFNAELQQVQIQRARLGAIVNLYKALRGGWIP